MKHHPTLYTASRYGAWCFCSCGWHCRAYTTVSGAHIAFGKHLLECVALERVTQRIAEEVDPIDPDELACNRSFCYTVKAAYDAGREATRNTRKD